MLLTGCTGAKLKKESGAVPPEKSISNQSNNITQNAAARATATTKGREALLKLRSQSSQ